MESICLPFCCSLEGRFRLESRVTARLSPAGSSVKGEVCIELWIALAQEIRWVEGDQGGHWQGLVQLVHLSLMAAETATLREELVADWALEWSVLRVRPKVVDQVAPAIERGVAALEQALVEQPPASVFIVAHADGSMPVRRNLVKLPATCRFHLLHLCRLGTHLFIVVTVQRVIRQRDGFFLLTAVRRCVLHGLAYLGHRALLDALR